MLRGKKQHLRMCHQIQNTPCQHRTPKPQRRTVAVNGRKNVPQDGHIGQRQRGAPSVTRDPRNV